MQPFLKTVAQQYAARYRSLDKFCFVFPGRRSASFFLKYLKESIGNRTMLAPRTATISDISADLSGRIIDNRIDLLIVLYQSYVAVMQRAGAKSVREFDQFRGIGEMILSDFNDVDSHLVDPDTLFQNLSDLREIATDFLTEEQREVLDEYFGVAPHEHIKSFWQHYNTGSTDTQIKSRFMALWQMLSPLYHEFNRRLDADGLTYSGHAERLAFEKVEEEGVDAFADTKLVFVGFNVLTTAEWRLFDTLRGLTTTVEGREEQFADFVWDIPGKVMQEGASSASRFVKRGMKRFPKPEWLDLSACDTEGLPETINVYSSPSNSAQAKMTGRKLSRLHASLTQEEFDEARIAVVLPDEGLLLPLINSLPEDIGGINLTMGCSMKYSPVVTLVGLLRRLQSRSRVNNGEDAFFHEDFRAVLMHPLTHLFANGEIINRLRNDINLVRSFFVTVADMNLPADCALRDLFVKLPKDASAMQTISYLDRLLAVVDDGYTDEGEFGKAHVQTYRRNLSRLGESLTRRKVEMAPMTVFLLADRLIAGETIHFEGEPLSGLQIMGLLETRSLDFNHIIIPSMNERIFPLRMRRRSFIPDSLRLGFRMSTVRSQESIFAYYFFRLISRAKSLTLIYDARTSGVRSGDPSRYILQLMHLYAGDRTKVRACKFAMNSSETSAIKMEKTDEVMQVLNRYTEPDGSELSASRLTDYFRCPLAFYYKTIEKLEIEEEPDEFLTPLDLGTIVHEVMMRLYAGNDEREHIIFSEPRRAIDIIDEITDEQIETLVRRAINKHYLKRPEKRFDDELEGEAAIQAMMMNRCIRKILNADRDTPGLMIHGLEALFDSRIDIGEGKEVNFTMIVDRIDSFIDENDIRRLRIVDYKTGKAHVEAETFEDIFNGYYKAKHLMQLFLYTDRLKQLPQYCREDVQQCICETSIAKMNYPTINKKTITGFNHIIYDEEGNEIVLGDAFRERMVQELRWLLDPRIPFCQTDNLKACSFCEYRPVCRR